MALSLEEVEAMVDALPPRDQILLLRHLVPRLADAVLAREPGSVCAGGTVADAAWRDFRRVGERLASTGNGQSITRTISQIRR